MRSWDCWDTLLARRSVKDVRHETDNVFPIAENVAKVRPDDILVSDYDDAALLRKLIPSITGLRNRLMVTTDGKLTGRIWSTLRSLGVTEHCGDDPHSDVVSPQAHGIRGILSTLTRLTAAEQSLSDGGLVALARCAREARLRQYSHVWRHLELLQTQINFPLLLIAAIILHREYPSRRFLMSSRDCFLWHRAQQFVRDVHREDYEVVYFQTSRIARAFPSPSYLRYVRGQLPAIITDVGGTGWSLARLLERVGCPETPVVLITRYDAEDLRAQYEAIGRTRSAGKVSALLRALVPAGHLEGMNLANHAMYSNPPETFNPLELDWERLPEVNAMHTAFFAALEAARLYDFRADFEVTDAVLQEQLYACFVRANQRLEWSQAVQKISAAEHAAVMQRLRELSEAGVSLDRPH